MIKASVSIVLSAAMALAPLNFPAAAETADALSDSGLSYTETVGTLPNPGAGYTTTVWAECAPGKTPVYDPKGSLVLFFIDIGKFSSGANGTTDDAGNYTPGEDYDLDETFFDSWDQTLANCKRNGCMVGLRFRYDAVGRDEPEPASFDKVLDHVEQIRESGLIDTYSDIIAFIETGFVGKWGEQHGGKYTSVEYKAKLLDAMYRAFPQTVPLTVRTPDTFAEWAGIKRSDLSNEEVFKAAADSSSSNARKILEKRIGMYNDGYMGSNSDLGTFADRAGETRWLSSVSTETYYGGEFSGNIDYAKQFDTYLPENAIPEMYLTHLSYINGNIFQLYKDYTFGSEYDVEGVDNSAYYGQNVFQFIRDHLGYRFVLRKSELTADVPQGGELKLRFSVENTGFSNPIPYVYGDLILEKDGVYIMAPVDTDCHKWLSRTTTETELTMKLPDSIRPGKWNVYLKETMGGYADADAGMSLRSIRFANEGVWNSTLGADLLGTVNITETGSHGTDNELKQVTKNGFGIGSDDFRYANCTPLIDGESSFDGEWTDDMLLYKGENGNSLYVNADEEYLYVRSDLPEGAAAPVYNISFNDPAKDNEHYWLYYASNGFIYFNHESYAGCDCKWKNGTVEFRLPLELFGLSAGSVIKNLRVSLQDSGNEWKLLGDAKAAECTVPFGITVRTAEKDIRLADGKDCVLTVKTPAKNVGFQWFRDGEPIEGATDRELSVKGNSAEKLGSYTVRISQGDTFAKTFPIANILDAETLPSALKGDANCDNEVNMADAVFIMQVISNPDKYRFSDEGLKNADVDGGGVTNKDALRIQQYKLNLIDSL